MAPAHEGELLASYMRSIAAIPAETPRALLVISAHWEASRPTVQTAPKPTLYYDYSGFPPAAYRLTWPAAGAPTVARRVRELLAGAGLKVDADDRRGFDHGTFIPLMLAWPKAEIPTVQLSLERSLDPACHLAIGRALAPLRDEGVFIIGSGNSYHNMRAFRQRTDHHRKASEAFDTWLNETVTRPPAVRDRRLERWTEAPDARLCHPREEHLIPLMVAAGAAGDTPGHVTWRGDLMGKALSAHHFG